MSSKVVIETTDTAEQVAETLKHYGLEAEAPDAESTEAAAAEDQKKSETPETPAPDAASSTVTPPAEGEETGKTAADQESAKKPQEQIKAEPVREDFDSEEQFSEALEDWKDKQKPKGEGGWQKRIDRLTKKLGKSEAARDELRRQVEAKSTPPAVERPAAEPAKPAETPPAPKPKVEDFASYEDYDEAIVDWKLSQRLGGKSVDQLVKEQVDARVAKEVETKVQEVLDQQARQEIIDTYNERLDEARQEYEDFDEVVSNGEIVINGLMGDIMHRSEVGPSMVYYFGSNPEEAERIYKLTDPIAIGIEMGKIEATIVHERKAAKAAAEPPKAETHAPAPPKPRASAAPPPMKPVKTAVAGVAAKNPGDMTPAEYNAWRDQGEK